MSSSPSCAKEAGAGDTSVMCDGYLLYTVCPQFSLRYWWVEENGCGDDGIAGRADDIRLAVGLRFSLNDLSG